MNLTWRRALRVLYVLVAACTLAALPVLILDFKNHDYSVHYKVRRYPETQRYSHSVS